MSDNNLRQFHVPVAHSSLTKRYVIIVVVFIKNKDTNKTYAYTTDDVYDCNTNDFYGRSITTGSIVVAAIP